MAKVIGVSNFDDPTVADCLICENCTEQNAKRIADWFNIHYGPKHEYFYVPRNDNYILREGIFE